MSETLNTIIAEAPQDEWILVYAPNQQLGSRQYGDDCPFHIAKRDGHKFFSIETQTEYHDYGGRTGMSIWQDQQEIFPIAWQHLPSSTKAKP